MRFWDASAVLPLLVHETRTAATEALFQDDRAQAVWCLTEIEIASALARRAREGLPEDRLGRARTQALWLAQRWTEISSVPLVKGRCIRLLNVHPLRASDALQLAAALVACEERPDSLPFVCLDDRLREAAGKEGFPVLPT